MQQNFSDALLEAIRFEHWLRFYFMEDTAETAVQRNEESAENSAVFDDGSQQPDARFFVPENWIARCREQEPHLLPLLQQLQGTGVSVDESRDHVFSFLMQTYQLDATQFDTAILKMIEDPDFRRALDAFHGFVQNKADADEEAEKSVSAGKNTASAAPAEEIPSYAEWMEEFKAWAKEKDIPYITTITPYSPEN